MYVKDNAQSKTIVYSETYRMELLTVAVSGKDITEAFGDNTHDDGNTDGTN